LFSFLFCLGDYIVSNTSPIRRPILAARKHVPGGGVGGFRTARRHVDNEPVQMLSRAVLNQRKHIRSHT
jgi:hypothetical protein